MNKRQRKKAWKQRMRPLHWTYYGTPLPRRVTAEVRLRLLIRSHTNVIQTLLENVSGASPLWKTVQRFW